MIGMTKLSVKETQLTAEVTALTLILQKVVGELAALDRKIAIRLEENVRNSFLDSKQAAVVGERELFFEALEGVVDTVFNAPKS